MAHVESMLHHSKTDDDPSKKLVAIMKLTNEIKLFKVLLAYVYALSSTVLVIVSQYYVLLSVYKS